MEEILTKRSVFFLERKTLPVSYLFLRPNSTTTTWLMWNRQYVIELEGNVVCTTSWMDCSKSASIVLGVIFCCEVFTCSNNIRLVYSLLCESSHTPSTANFQGMLRWVNTKYKVKSNKRKCNRTIFKSTVKGPSTKPCHVFIPSSLQNVGILSGSLTPLSYCRKGQLSTIFWNYFDTSNPVLLSGRRGTTFSFCLHGRNSADNLRTEGNFVFQPA